MQKSTKYYKALAEHYSISRRGLFRSLLKSIKTPPTSHKRSCLRPPNAIDEILFLQTCSRCSACVDACPHSMIRFENGLPVLSFLGSFCDGCKKCIVVCPTGALENRALVDISARPKLGTSCKNAKVLCQACRDVCPNDAIVWQLYKLPSVNLEQCNGCGACHFSCKTWSMELI